MVDSGVRTTPYKKLNVFSHSRYAKSRSSVGISGPRDVISIEVTTGRDWREVTSTDGVVAFVANLRPRALCEHDFHHHDRVEKVAGGRS